MDVEELVLSDLVRDNDQIEEARDEMQERIEEDLREITEKYGRKDVSVALRRTYSDYAGRRFVNPYPISEKHFDHLVKMTGSDRIRSKDISQKELLMEYWGYIESMEHWQQKYIVSMVQEEGDSALFALVDLLLSDVDGEKRNEYVSYVVDDLYTNIKV